MLLYRNKIVLAVQFRSQEKKEVFVCLFCFVLLTQKLKFLMKVCSKRNCQFEIKRANII